MSNTSAEYRVLVLRAIAYLIDRGEVEVGWEQHMQGDGTSTPEGMTRFVIELDSNALWRTVSAIERRQPRPPRVRATNSR